MQYTVYLGSKCNLNCAYCHKEAGKESGISDEFIARLKAEGATDIRFMGGEPTLYMDEIRKVVGNFPDVQFAITTNGVLFDKYIDYFREHNFLVCISYDGTDKDLRGFDPFTKLIDYPKIAVSCTLYHGNCDFREIMRNFAKKEEIIGRKLSFFPHIAHSTYDGNDEYSLNIDELVSVIRQYKEAIVRFTDDLRMGVTNLRWKPIVIQLLKRLKAGYEFGETYCVHKNLKKVDTSGRFYSCHYIRDEELPKGEELESMAGIIRKKFPKCESCPVYDMCGAACIKSKRHELECFFYHRLFTWFRDFYTANADILGGIKV